MSEREHVVIFQNLPGELEYITGIVVLRAFVLRQAIKPVHLPLLHQSCLDRHVHQSAAVSDPPG